MLDIWQIYARRLVLRQYHTCRKLQSGSLLDLLCGLCGNYDAIASNDLMTPDGVLVGGTIVFGNSWKTEFDCPDVNHIVADFCVEHPTRTEWATHECSIIMDPEIFGHCHAAVNPIYYFEICKSDTCACESGGDCECLCSAVAAYAHQCGQAGQPINWRRPDFCPVMCEFYNYDPITCEWKYLPCGNTCPVSCCEEPIGYEDCDTGCVEGNGFLRDSSIDRQINEKLTVFNFNFSSRQSG